jgi:hypothetical protein
MQLSKRELHPITRVSLFLSYETHILWMHLPFFLDARHNSLVRIYLFLHQKLNNCQIQYSVDQKLNTRLQKLHTGHQK